jgi:Fur family ferric uptake transcriptional regulator
MQRETRQRKAIRKVFLDSSRPLSPDEVLDKGQRQVPGLGIATVYRNVKLLAEEGWLTEVELPGSGARYELAERPHHHHFVCRACDQAFDVHGCPPQVEELAPQGFVVEDHEVILYGRCPSCV